MKRFGLRKEKSLRKEKKKERKNARSMKIWN